MKPLDPRLARYAKAARSYIIFTAVTGFLTAAAIVSQAALIAYVIAPVITSKQSLNALALPLALLAGVLVVRVAITYLQEARAHRAATQTVVQLRKRVLEQAIAAGPRWRSTNTSQSATLATRGLDDLEPYFTRYLPQLLLAATVTPATALVMFTQDIPSAIAVVATIPLIPIFMSLIGKLTSQYSN